MFLNYIATLNLLMHDEESNICAEFPLNIRKEMCKMICKHFSDLKTARASITSVAHAKFAMEIIGESFRLPIEEAETISLAIDIYKAWLLEPDAFKPLPLVAPEHKQSFIVTMILHTSLLFDPRSGSVEKHSQLCHKVLSVYESLIRDNDGHATTNLEAETWHVILKTILGCTDFMLRVPPEKDTPSLGSSLSKHIIKVLYETFLRSNTDEKDLWVKFTSFACQWNHYVCCILTWKSFMLGLTRRVIKLLFGYGTGIPSEKIVVKLDDNLTLTMNEEKTFFCWLRVIYMIGNPNKLTDPQIFLSAMGGVAAFVDLFLDVITGNGTANNAPGPHVQSILKMVGHWLFEAASFGRKGFGEGRGVALATLCRLLCCPTSYGLLKNKTLPKPYLASIYRSITSALEEVIPGEVSASSNDDKSKSSDIVTDYVLGSDSSMAGECASAVLLYSVPIFSGAERDGALTLVPLYVSVMEKILCNASPSNLKLPVPLNAVREACYNISGTLLCLPNRYSDLEFINWQNGVAFGTSETASGAKLPQLNSFTVLNDHLMYILLEAIHTEKDNVNMAKAVNLLSVLTCEQLLVAPKTIDLSVTAIRSILQKSDWDASVYLACFDMFWIMIEKFQALKQNTEFVFRKVLVALSELVDAFVNLFVSVNKSSSMPRHSRRDEKDAAELEVDRITTVLEAGLACMSVWASVGLTNVDSACAHRVIAAIDHAMTASDSFPEDSGVSIISANMDNAGIESLSYSIGVAGAVSSTVAVDSRSAARRIYDAALSSLGDILHFQHQVVSPSGMENTSSFVSEVDFAARWNRWCHINKQDTGKIYDEDLGVVDCALGKGAWVNSLPSREPVNNTTPDCNCNCNDHLHTNKNRCLRDLLDGRAACTCGCDAACMHDSIAASKCWFFLLRDGSVMSIVEQGQVEAASTPASVTGGKDTIGVCPLVAVIVRNERGKFVWQATMKYLSTIKSSATPDPANERRESMLLVAPPVTDVPEPMQPTSTVECHVEQEEQKPTSYAGFEALLKKIRNSHEDVEIVQQVTDKLLERQLEIQSKVEQTILASENALDCKGFPKSESPNLPNRYSNPGTQQQISRLFLTHLGLVNGSGVASQFVTAGSVAPIDRKKKQGAQPQAAAAASDNRNHRIIMLEPTPGLLDTLDLLDRTPARDRLVVSVLYRCDGQHTLRDLVQDSRGSVISNDFVEFVRALGWPVCKKDMGGILPPLPAVFPYYADLTRETVFHVPAIGSTVDDSGGGVDNHMAALKASNVIVMFAGNSEPLITCPLTAESMVPIGSKVMILVTPQKSSMYYVRVLNVTVDPVSKTMKQTPLSNFRGPLRDHMLLSQFVIGPLVRFTAINLALNAQLSDNRYTSPAMRRRALLQATAQYRRVGNVSDTYSEYFKGPASLTI